MSEVGQDVVSVQSTNGINPGRQVAVSGFIFPCASAFLPIRQAKSASGMAGLGRAKISLPSQFASAFNFPEKFAICLSSSSRGVVFFGDGPYVFQPNVDAAQSLAYTPLILNRPSKADIITQKQTSSEYYIGVESIKVDGKVVPKIKKKLLSINKEGHGGTKISTLHPYTVLEKSIYRAVTKAFLRGMAARNYTRVTHIVSRFRYCFSKHNIGSTRPGAAVPAIELVLQNNVTWHIFGANSMVREDEEEENAMCLGLEDGGNNRPASIVIGGYQLENNLLQFDLASSRLGFSSLLFGRRTTCGNFKFNSAA